MNVLDLFSGIGGFSLGLERAGMRTVAFCEIDPFNRAILASHWPGVPQYEDVRTLTAARLAADGITADAICGGFPCQDISVANIGGEGLAGPKSGLWSEYRRLIREIRPRVVVVENVAAILDRGLGSVLSDLAALGYDCWWDCIPAYTVGAAHRRDRFWLVAYPCSEGRERLESFIRALGSSLATLPEHDDALAGARSALDGDLSNLRTGDGLSVTMERRRLFGCGNAVVPKIPEIIGRAIMRAGSIDD